MLVQDIRVGGRNFEGSRWREAILYYLFMVWKGGYNDSFVMSFGPVGLHRCVHYGVYYGAKKPEQNGRMTIAYDGWKGIEIVVNEVEDCESIEVALARLAKNDSVSQVHLCFPREDLVLGKARNKSELHVFYR